MNAADLVPIIVALLGSGGFLGAIYALLKLRPEAGQIVVTAAQGALVVQEGVIESLQAQNRSLHEENHELRLEVAALRARVSVLERQIRDEKE